MGTDALETGGAMAVAEGAGDLLSRDTIPDENQSLTCFACDTAMVGLFCHECGNKNDNYRRSLWSLVVEMFSNITAMDNRMWRTLWSLVRRPGLAAREYADGARSRWTSPVRFYLATSLMLFGYIALSGTQLVAFGERIAPDDRTTPALRTENGGQALQFFIRDSQLVTLDREDTQRLFGEVRAELESGDEIAGLDASIAALDTQIETNPVPQVREALRATRDNMQARRDQLAASAEGSADDGDADGGGGNTVILNTSGERVELSNAAITSIFDRIVRNPAVINDGVNARLKLAMFFMLPFAMLMGAIFIRGRDRAMLYDHLVHAAYIHGVSFLLLLVFVLLHQYTALPALLGVYTLILLVYLPVSARRMFGRGWFKSFLTAYGVGAVYTAIIAGAFVAFVALELQTIASEYTQTTPVEQSTG